MSNAFVQAGCCNFNVKIGMGNTGRVSQKSHRYIGNDGTRQTFICNVSRGNRTPGSRVATPVATHCSVLQFVPINAHATWQPRSVNR